MEEKAKTLPELYEATAEFYRKFMKLKEEIKKRGHFIPDDGFRAFIYHQELISKGFDEEGIKRCEKNTPLEERGNLTYLLIFRQAVIYLAVNLLMRQSASRTNQTQSNTKR